MGVTSFDYKLEPPTSEPVAYCEVCGEALYDGEEVYIFDDDYNTYLCSEDCIVDYGGIKKITLGDE